MPRIPGYNNCLSADFFPRVRAQREGPWLAGKSLDPPAEQARRSKRCDLPLKFADQGTGMDLRVRRDVVDRLLGIERGALPTHLRKRVDQQAAELQHTELEDGKQAYRPGTDDRYIRLDCLRHPASLPARGSRAKSCPADCSRIRHSGRLIGCAPCLSL